MRSCRSVMQSRWATVGVGVSLLWAQRSQRERPRGFLGWPHPQLKPLHLLPFPRTASLGWLATLARTLSSVIFSVSSLRTAHWDQATASVWESSPPSPSLLPRGPWPSHDCWRQPHRTTSRSALWSRWNMHSWTFVCYFLCSQLWPPLVPEKVTSLFSEENRPSEFFTDKINYLELDVEPENSQAQPLKN